MNIAFFTISRVNPHVGGVERITYNLSETLRKRGHKIFNFFYNGEDDGDVNFLIPKSDTNRITATIDKIIEERDIDILVDQNNWSACHTHQLLKSKVKIIRCIHYDTGKTNNTFSLLLSNFNLLNFKDSLLNILFWLNTPRRILSHDKRLSSLSLGVDKLILLDEGFYMPPNIERNLVAAIPNGIPVVDYNLGHKKKQIVFVGRLIHNPKNTRFLVRLWKALYSEFPDWEFIICGDGPDKKVMEYYVHRHSLERIYFKGCVDPTPYYRDSSILVLPSFYEGFGMVLLEGMQYGCIPIVFDISTAFHKICEDSNHLENDGSSTKCGIVVKAMDNKAFIEECRSLMIDTDRRARMALAAIEHAKDYDIEIITDRWELLFSELMTTGKNIS